MAPRLAHPWIRATTVGELRNGGYDVIMDEPPPAHALIMLPRVPADHDFLTIASVLGEPCRNPAQGKDDA